MTFVKSFFPILLLFDFNGVKPSRSGKLMSFEKVFVKVVEAKK